MALNAKYQSQTTTQFGEVVTIYFDDADSKPYCKVDANTAVKIVDTAFTPTRPTAVYELPSGWLYAYWWNDAHTAYITYLSKKRGASGSWALDT